MPYEKVGDNEPVCIADEVPFDIPGGWEWCRLGNYCIDVFNGKSPVYEKHPTNYHIIGQAANKQDGIDLSEVKYTNKDFWDSMGEKYFLRNNDILLNTLGNGTLGRTGIVKNLNYNLLTDGHLFIFRTISKYSSVFLYFYLQLMKNKIEKSASGTTNQTFLNLSNVSKWLIPLPPLAEQQRIVTEIEKYLPLINEYDKLQTELDTLDKEFPEKLKKSILQEAIKGKLVEQDPNDDPASVLLDKIRKEKEKLIKEGKIKKDKNESIIYKRDNSYYEKLNGVERCIDDEIPFEIPESWEWCRLGNISETNIGLTYKPSDKTDKGILVLRSNNIQSGLMNYEDCIYVSCRVSSRVMINKNDILICVRNGSRSLVGKCAIVDKDGMAFGAFMAKINSKCYLYIKTFIDSPVFRNQLDGVKTETINQITQDMLKKQLIPLPPYVEQSRIINKVNEIFNNIDMLL